MSVPKIRAEYVSMDERRTRFAEEIPRAEHALRDAEGFYLRRVREQDDARQRVEEVQKKLIAAKADFENKTVSRGAVTLQEEALRKARNRVKEVERNLEIAERKRGEAQALLNTLRKDDRALEQMLRYSDEVVAYKDATIRFDEARRAMFREDGADENFAEEMGAHAATVHRINEEVSRLDAERMKSAEALRAYVQARPDGYYDTDTDSYPVKVLGNFIVYVKLAPRYYYKRDDVALLLGHDPAVFAPRYLQIERPAFEREVRAGKLQKSDGTVVTMEDVAPLLQVEYQTPSVMVRHLAPGEKADIRPIPESVANEPIGVIDDPEAVRWLEEQMRASVPMEEGAPSQSPPESRLRDVLRHPRRVIESVLGHERARGILSRVFGK